MPKLRPPNQVRMIYEALRINVLAWTDHHCLGGYDVDHGRLPRVCVGNPYRNREAIGGAAEVDGEGAREVEEQGIGAVGKGWQGQSRRDMASGEQRRQYCERLFAAQERDIG